MRITTSDYEEVIPQWLARLSDPLSLPTRSKRRLLMIASTISLVAVLLGLFPTKIEALGIAIESKNQHDLLLLLFVVNSYALLGFLLYAISDFLMQRRIQNNASTGYVSEFSRGRAYPHESISYFFRFTFDFLVPIVYGIYTLYKLYYVVQMH